MSSYPRRYFRLRYERGWDAPLVEIVVTGYREWLEWAKSVLQTWSEVPHRAKLPKPTYRFGEPSLSEDSKVITIPIDGDPITHGAMMVFEDGVPPSLYIHLPIEVLGEIELLYDNPGLQLVFPQHWQRPLV